MRIAAALACVLALTAAQVASAAGAAMVTAPMKGSGAGVGVQYRVDGTPEVGRPVSVLLSFDGITDPAGASVRLSTQGGLSLVGTESTRSLPTAQTSTWTVQVVPAADGLGYLNVFTTQGGATSATSVPVPVGKPSAALPASQDLKRSADGEKILPMQVK
ncbi:hypothetical protein [Variovorax saccharolyticus]|uniref:hypothetical protein n=1 Tax=Variovorax saccharolyticus TaxID=3053516 RepID=UPI0025786D09|nr:hypothetical protein [Variovorax sp. J31P216]MDM0026777.1 hypothetical protein [Variovorax sp. J31P216]